MKSQPRERDCDKKRDQPSEGKVKGQTAAAKKIEIATRCMAKAV
jgi:hypothetical protein